MTLLNIADMLADVLGFDDVYAGTVYSNLDRCIGVYPVKNSSGANKICLGGKPNTKTHEKKVSILIHWTSAPVAAEQEAIAVMESLSDIRDYESEEHIVRFVQPNKPISIGKDDRGIYEYVIDAKIYYERKE